MLKRFDYRLLRQLLLFAVVVEEGGSGASAAGSVAAQVLDALVNGY